MKKLLSVILTVSLTLSLTACGADTSAEDSSPLPPDLSGQWQQVNNESEDNYHGAIISGNKIEIYWVSNNGDTRSLYWSGSFAAPNTADEPYSWISQNDTEKTGGAILASQDDTKEFTYADNQISYSSSIMGTTTTVRLEQKEWAPGLKIKEDVRSNSSDLEIAEPPTTNERSHDNVPFSVAGFDFSIPSYYEKAEPQTNGDTEIIDFEYYKNGELLARLRFAEEDLSATQEEFDAGKDKITENIMSGFDTAKLIESKDTTLAGLSARYFSFVAINDANAKINGHITFTYNDADGKLLCVMLSYGQESDLLTDYNQIIETATLATSKEVNSTSSPISGIRPEFKEAMDSYEAFFDEYIAFMERYANSDNPLNLLADYANYMTKYTETMTALGQINDGSLSTEELAYYVEVQSRITQKLLTVAQ